VTIAPKVVSDRVLSLPSAVLGLDLHLYPDLGFRFYDPISEQILRSYAEAEFERSLERQFRLQAEQQKQEAEAIALQERQQKEKLAAYLRALGINPDEIWSDWNAEGLRWCLHIFQINTHFHLS